jgi:hypothetical protein
MGRIVASRQADADLVVFVRLAVFDVLNSVRAADATTTASIGFCLLASADDEIARLALDSGGEQPVVNSLTASLFRDCFASGDGVSFFFVVDADDARFDESVEVMTYAAKIARMEFDDVPSALTSVAQREIEDAVRAELAVEFMVRRREIDDDFDAQFNEIRAASGPQPFMSALQVRLQEDFHHGEEYEVQRIMDERDRGVGRIDDVRAALFRTTRRCDALRSELDEKERERAAAMEKRDQFRAALERLQAKHAATEDRIAENLRKIEEDGAAEVRALEVRLAELRRQTLLQGSL